MLTEMWIGNEFPRVEGLFHTLYWSKKFMFPRKTSTIAGSAVTIDRSGNSAPEIEGGQKGSIFFSEDISKVHAAYGVINV